MEIKSEQTHSVLAPTRGREETIVQGKRKGENSWVFLNLDIAQLSEGENVYITNHPLRYRLNSSTHEFAVAERFFQLKVGWLKGWTLAKFML